MSQAVSTDGNGISRTYDETLGEASGIIGQYIVEGDVDRPLIETSADELALKIVKRKLEQAGRPFKANDGVAGALQERALDKVQTFLKFRCTDEETAYPATPKRSARTGKTFVQLDPVYLDLDGLGDSGACPPWAPQQRNATTEVITMVPAIYFASLDPIRDAMFVPGKCEAIAVYADPNQVVERRYSEWKMASGGTVPTESVSDWAPEQYIGIVRTFGSFASMKQAHADLKRAIRTVYHTPTPTDLADDGDDGLPPIDTYEGEDIDLDDVEGIG